MASSPALPTRAAARGRHLTLTWQQAGFEREQAHNGTRNGNGKHGVTLIPLPSTASHPWGREDTCERAQRIYQP